MTSIYLPTHASLLQKAIQAAPLQVETIDPTLRKLEDSALIEMDVKKSGFCGLAAPQIGIDQQIIIVNARLTNTISRSNTTTFFINPNIIEYSSEKQEGPEGCYSIDRRIRGVVKRSLSIIVEYYTLDEKRSLIRKNQRFQGFAAVILQHEIDHLHGILFPDRILEQGGNLHWVEDNEIIDYRQNFTKWPKECSKEMWAALKQGKTPTTTQSL
jgi:peptide deformylase